MRYDQADNLAKERAARTGVTQYIYGDPESYDGYYISDLPPGQDGRNHLAMVTSEHAKEELLSLDRPRQRQERFKGILL